MCGRYTLTRVDDLEPFFELDERPSILPRYNIAPSQEIAVVRQGDEGRRHLDLMRWGLIGGGSSTAVKQVINARRETIDRKPMFREAFRRARCLIPADGFYEWRKGPSGRQPYYFRRLEGGLFAFAGLWRWWVDPEGREIPTCVIVTTDANSLVNPIHDRMPVILPPNHHRLWLDREAPGWALKELLTPFPTEEMAAVAVSPAVNSPFNDSPECLLPPPPDTKPKQTSLF